MTCYTLTYVGFVMTQWVEDAFMALIDKNQAVQIAQDYVQHLDNYEAAGGLALLVDYTREKPYGWVFFYNTRAFAETHDSTVALTGNAPFLVEREGGSVHVLGTAQPLEDYLGAYEPQGETPAVVPSLLGTDLNTLSPASSQTFPGNSNGPRKRSRQGIIASVTAALFIATSVSLFGVYHQEQIASTHLVATVTQVARVTQQNEQQRLGVDATATALVVAAHSPYHVDVPGSCDTGNATWRIQSNATTSCVNGALQMTPTTASYLGEVDFQWIFPLVFPANTSVEVTIKPVNDCGGILLRQSANDGSGGYGFFICSDNGYWSISRYDPNTGNPIVLTYGHAPVQASYDVKAVANGAKETLSIDGTVVSNVTDSTFLTADHIALAVGATNESGPVAFSNFTFTPLP